MLVIVPGLMYAMSSAVLVKNSDMNTDSMCGTYTSSPL